MRSYENYKERLDGTSRTLTIFVEKLHRKFVRNQKLTSEFENNTRAVDEDFAYKRLETWLVNSQATELGFDEKTDFDTVLNWLGQIHFVGIYEFSRICESC